MKKDGKINKKLIAILIAWAIGSGVGWLVAEYAIRAV
jgi:hypothetical protein